MSARHQDNLLIIEDHRDIAAMVTSYLEGRGFAVDYAADGLTGMHLAVQNNYDAIVLDLMLPGLDGLSICQKLRQEARDSTPIIMLTARDTLDDKVNGLSTGADRFVSRRRGPSLGPGLKLASPLGRRALRRSMHLVFVEPGKPCMDRRPRQARALSCRAFSGRVSD